MHLGEILHLFRGRPSVSETADLASQRESGSVTLRPGNANESALHRAIVIHHPLDLGAIEVETLRHRPVPPHIETEEKATLDELRLPDLLVVVIPRLFHPQLALPTPLLNLLPSRGAMATLCYLHPRDRPGVDVGVLDTMLRETSLARPLDDVARRIGEGEVEVVTIVDPTADRITVDRPLGPEGL
jgi:hypothetical protein